MSRMLKLADHAEQAAIARCDLNVLYSVIAILEGGTISSNHSADVNAIITRCKAGSQRALRRYDKHMAAIKEGWEQ